ncbi:Uncharacterized protein TCM_030309 [Theobroma cacao]|uniref:Uncharacterized protein n=1 Tax=Theobroma cacao TaxID=3641 RepID=A0A061GHD8_THECC|nr:Uncharacterized protein TCM_030309 [Theobroma cacao]
MASCACTLLALWRQRVLIDDPVLSWLGSRAFSSSSSVAIFALVGGARVPPQQHPTTKSTMANWHCAYDEDAPNGQLPPRSPMGKWQGRETKAAMFLYRIWLIAQGPWASLFFL